MSIGNLKTDGGKGTNWPWQYKMLLGLDKIAAAIVTDGKDYESDLISIKCGANPAIIRLEVRIFDTTTGAFTDIELYPPGSLIEDTTDYSTCTKTYLDAGDATEATLQAIEAINTDIEAKTTLVVANTDEIKGFNETIKDNTTAVTGITPALLRPTTSGSVAAGARSVSIANVGAESGTVLGIELAAGETVNFDAGSLNNTLAAVTYDPTTPGTGTTFLIATLT